MKLSEKIKSSSASSRRYSYILIFAIVVVCAVYFLHPTQNPPGYYIDESSISYNAYTISQAGRDEFGQTMPLYFRAFGDYKNPVYIYLLAAIFRVTGPSILAARVLSICCGLLAALMLGLLASKLTRRKESMLFVVLMTLLTPWLFEISRVVLEVAMYPALVALFLYCALHASKKSRWSWREIVCLTATLALLTYTYSIGRLLAPLFALGLLFLATRGRRAAVAIVWGGYAFTLLPLLIFQQRYPGALTGRFFLVSYLKPGATFLNGLLEFLKHLAGNINLWRLFVTGDPNVDQIAHIHGTPLLLAATGLLAALGLWLIANQHRGDAWWRLVIYCCVMSLVPASLTKEPVHMLRLAPLPIFVIVFAVPAIDWLKERSFRSRALLSFLMLAVVAQGALFWWKFEATANSAKRLRQFDNGYPEQIFDRAVAKSERPIYLADALAIPGYIQAYWYATLKGIPLSNFSRLAPDLSAPEGTLVITTEENCPRCSIISSSEFYTLYIATGPPVKREPLPNSAFRAQLSAVNPVSVLRAGQLADFMILVKNNSDSVWFARERSGGPLQVSAGNHWLDQNGVVVISDDGRAALLQDLRPSEQVLLKLTVNAPERPGHYILEVDMLQEGVSWFGLRGSLTLKLPVQVK